MNSIKICLECAEGGHLIEMQSLMDAFKGHEVFFITIRAPTTEKLALKYKVYFTRTQSNIMKKWIVYLMEFAIFFKLVFVIFFILQKERPKIIISTGGESTIPLCYVGKLMGIKIIYIESMARVKDLSLTGRIVYPVSDLFLVQWTNLLKYYKKSRYWGKVYDICNYGDWSEGLR